MIGLGRLGRLVLMGLPFLWLMLFFLLPLLIVLKISVAESIVAAPPFIPLSERPFSEKPPDPSVCLKGEALPWILATACGRSASLSHYTSIILR